MWYTQTLRPTFMVFPAATPHNRQHQHYVGLYGGDSKLLLESLQYIQQAANRILTAITPDNSETPA